MNDLKKITSKNNSLIKLACELNKHKKQRYEHMQFVIEGFRLVQEALKSKLNILYCFITPAFAAKYADFIKNISVVGNVFLIDESLEKKLSQNTTPAGIYCVCQMPKLTLNFNNLPSKSIALIDLQDPGNLGTIIRTAEAFGVNNIFISKNSVDVFSPKVIKASMGSCFRVKIMQIDDVTGFISRCHKAGIATYAAVLAENSSNFLNIKFEPNAMVFIGNEGNGLPKDIADLIKYHVKIPMEAPVESLNAAVAAALFLYKLYT
ncbi:MAG: RNA methyltransferase [Oscillospiraceae bacterium]|nr:RNA methyltransferase [Oscillospiraceae bacterium]